MVTTKRKLPLGIVAQRKRRTRPRSYLKIRAALAAQPRHHAEYREIHAALDALLQIAVTPRIARQIAPQVRRVRKMAAALQLKDSLERPTLMMRLETSAKQRGGARKTNEGKTEESAFYDTGHLTQLVVRAARLYWDLRPNHDGESADTYAEMCEVLTIGARRLQDVLKIARDARLIPSDYRSKDSRSQYPENLEMLRTAVASFLQRLHQKTSHAQASA